MTARMTLRVVQDQPLALTFNTGQLYDLVIRNANGDGVYRWSNGTYDEIGDESPKPAG